MSDDLNIQFGASADSVTPVVEKVNTELGTVNTNLGKINATAKEMADQINAAFSQLNTTVTKVAENTQQAQRRVADGNQRAESSAGSLGSTMARVGAAVVAAFSVQAIWSFTNSIAAAAEQVTDLGQKLGTTIRETQILIGVADAGHVSIETMASALAQLDRQFGNARNGAAGPSAAFRQIGVDVREDVTQMQLLRSVLEKFAELPDGPAKTALAMQLLGRSALDLIPLLNGGKEGFAALEQKLERYGVLNETAVRAGSQLSGTLAEQRMASKGLGNVIAQELAPTINIIVGGFNDFAAACIKSYREGGTMKGVLDGVGVAVKAVAILIAALATGIGMVPDIMNLAAIQLVAAWRTIKEEVATNCRQIGILANAAGKVIYDSLTMNAFAAARDMAGAFEQIEAEQRRHVFRMRAIAADAKEQSAPFTANMGAGVANFGLFSNGLANAGAPSGGPPGKPPGDTTDILGGGAGGSSGPTQVQRWEQTLHQMEIASGEFFKDQTQLELAFWQEKLALTAQGSADWLAIQDKIFNLSRQRAREDFDEKIAGLDAQIQAQRENGVEAMKLEAEKVATIKATYGEQSREYQEALREQERMRQQFERQQIETTLQTIERQTQIKQHGAESELDIQRMALQEELRNIDLRERRGQITATQAIDQRNAVNARILALEAEHEERMYQLALEGLRAKVAALALFPEEQARVNAEIEQLEQEHQDRMAVIRAQADQQSRDATTQHAESVRQTWEDRLRPLGQTMASVGAQLIQRTITWRDALNQVWSTMVNQFTQWIAKLVIKWAASEITKTTATVGGVAARTTAEAAGAATSEAITIGSTLKAIGAFAAKAAAGAWAAISSIPVVGPVLAPIAAGAALAGVLALGKSVFSAAGGWGDVPHDGAVTELHRREMVLPASIAVPLRNAISGVTGGGSGAGGLGGLSVAASFPITAMDGKSVKRIIEANAETFVDVIESELRRRLFPRG